MPVTECRQAQDVTQRLGLNDLPAEIIQEIAHHLDPDPQETDSSEFSDVDYNQMSVTSMDPEDGKPAIKVMPCCRPGDEKALADDSRIPILNDRSNFSATSRMIYNVVAEGRLTRRRTIWYCQKWIQETKQIPEATRSRYT